MRKSAAVILASALAFSIVFSGCSSGKSTKSTTSSKNSTPLTLRVENFDRSDAPSPYSAIDNPMSRWIIQKVKEDLNISLTFVAVPRSQEVDKLNVMMAGGTAPDIIFTYHGDLAASFANQGGLTDLTSYISKYAPNVKTSMKSTLKYGVINNKQYTIPCKRVDGYDMHMAYVNTTLLSKYNLKMPTTKSELYQDMATIHKADPSVIGYAMASPTYDVKYYEEMVLSYAKYANDKEFQTWDIDDTRLLAPGTKDGYKELNKWYNEGLISKDFALDTQEKQFDADATNGKVFSMLVQPTDPWGWEADAQKANGSYYMPTLVFENYKNEYANPLYDPIGVYSMVPKKSEKNAQAAMQYLNWMLDDNNFNQIRSGAAIGAAQKNSDGVFVPTVSDLKTKGVTSAILNDLSLIAKSNIEYTTEQHKMVDKINNPSVPNIDKLLDQYYSIQSPKGSYNVPYIGAPGEAAGKYGSNVLNAIHSMAARVITCKESDFDSTWTTEYNNVTNSGLKEILAERDKEYDTYTKK